MTTRLSIDDQPIQTTTPVHSGQQVEAKQLLLLALGMVHTIVGEIGELLPDAPYQLMPLTFELKLIHDQVLKGLGSRQEPLERWDLCQCRFVRLSRLCSFIHSGHGTGYLVL
ncbi:MAG: hypothetical protein ACKO22_12710 [Cyanobium sp.]